MRRCFTLLIVNLATVTFPAVCCAAAGKIEFVIGEAQAMNTAGAKRVLKKASAVDQGDTIVTGKDSSAQIRFSDNGFVSLQPNTSFRVDEYRFNQKKDDKSFFSLLKGGLRTITGGIPKKNKEAYQVKTVVAVIGVRGTHFTLRLCDNDCVSPNGSKVPDGLYAGVASGGIYLSNTAGKLDLDPGRMAYVSGNNVMPIPIKSLPFSAFAPSIRDREGRFAKEDDDSDIRKGMKRGRSGESPNKNSYNKRGEIEGKLSGTRDEEGVTAKSSGTEREAKQEKNVDFSSRFSQSKLNDIEERSGRSPSKYGGGSDFSLGSSGKSAVGDGGKDSQGFSAGSNKGFGGDNDFRTIRDVLHDFRDSEDVIRGRRGRRP